MHASTVFLLALYIYIYIFRQKTIEENMRRMPQMVADYRKQRKELREATRTSKEKTEEEKYLLATGKLKEKAPLWQMIKDSKR